MDCYLGVDMGTSSLKATLMEADGTILLQTSRPTGILNPEEGMFEADSEKVWWKNFLSVCEEIKEKGYAPHVSGICVSSVCATFLPVDADFRPIYNAVLYGIDRRGVQIADELNMRYGNDFLIKKLGSAFSTQSILPKILWFKRERPDIYKAAHAFVPSFDAVSSRLTGSCAWDIPTAFGALLLEIDTLSYPKWLLEEHGIDISQMPQVKGALSALAPLSRYGSSVTGFREGITVMTGTGDINADAMSAGAIDIGSATFTLGSTISMLLNCASPMRVPGFISGASVRDGTWRIGAASSCGGLFLNWARERFGHVPPPSVPTGIFFLPYTEGARCPYNNPAARGGILGLNASHTTSDIAAAAYETIGYDVALLMHKAGSAQEFPDSLHITGGLCRDADLARMIADITGKTLLIHTSRDASCGCAMIAAGEANGMKYPKVVPDAVIEPDEKRSRLYSPLREAYIGLCDSIIAPH